MQQSLICRMGGWLLWGSLFILMGVALVALSLPFVANASNAAGEVILTALQVGFATVLGAFLLGAACHLFEGWASRRGNYRR